MTALEAINESEKYSIYPGTITLVPTSNQTPFIKENKIYCTGLIKNNNITYGFFKIELDGRILQGLPNYIDYQIQLKSKLYYLWKRIDTFFKDIITFAEFADNNRELVNLRINVNLIYNLPINHEDKNIWADWIKELYWNRKVILNKWYIDNILPF